jgi:GH18 family chitinase
MNELRMLHLIVVVCEITVTKKPGNARFSDDTGDGGPLNGGPNQVASAGCGKRVVGYFTSWGDRTFSGAQASYLTHAIFAFFEMKADGTVKIGAVSVDKDAAEQTAMAQKRLDRFLAVTKANNIKRMFAAGGWDNSQYFSAIASNAGSRQAFINSVVAAIDKYDFDGIDVDWEYPVTGGAQEGTKADKQNFVTLLKEMRTAFSNHQVHFINFVHYFSWLLLHENFSETERT